jgi:hypothetical protein
MMHKLHVLNMLYFFEYYMHILLDMGIIMNMSSNLMISLVENLDLFFTGFLSKI